MIPRNAEPIGHRPPLAPIDLQPARRLTGEVGRASFSYSPVHTERVWKLLQQAAQGVSAPVVTDGLPNDWSDVDTSGWEAA